jgi:hypothetical protein
MWSGVEIDTTSKRHNQIIDKYENKLSSKIY